LKKLFGNQFMCLTRNYNDSPIKATIGAIFATLVSLASNPATAEPLQCATGQQKYYIAFTANFNDESGVNYGAKTVCVISGVDSPLDSEGLIIQRERIVAVLQSKQAIKSPPIVIITFFARLND
jgi:hypothetical protein